VESEGRWAGVSRGGMYNGMGQKQSLGTILTEFVALVLPLRKRAIGREPKAAGAETIRLTAIPGGSGIASSGRASNTSGIRGDAYDDDSDRGDPPVAVRPRVRGECGTALAATRGSREKWLWCPSLEKGPRPLAVGDAWR
jgi:hypothetical protein